MGIVFSFYGLKSHIQIPFSKLLKHSLVVLSKTLTGDTETAFRAGEMPLCQQRLLELDPPSSSRLPARPPKLKGGSQEEKPVPHPTPSTKDTPDGPKALR